MRGRLITLQGPEDVDPRTLNDVEAGLHFLATASKAFPGVTWGELVAMANESPVVTLSGKEKCRWYQVWCKTRNLGKDIWQAGGEIKEAVGGTLRDALNFTGKKTGQAVRLVADEDVQKTIARGAAAYMSGGTSEAVNAAMSDRGPFGNFLASLGSIWKGEGEAARATQAGVAATNWMPWIVLLGGGALIAMTLARPRVIQAAPPMGR